MTPAPALPRVMRPVCTSDQLVVPVESKGLYCTTEARGAMPITPEPSWPATIRLATPAPCGFEKFDTPVELRTLSWMSDAFLMVKSSRPTTVFEPDPWICVSDGVQFTSLIQWSMWSVPVYSISPS